MNQETAQTHSLLDAVVSPGVSRARLAIGLLQGLALYGLYRSAQPASGLATLPYLFAPLFLISLLVPIVIISSLGHLRRVAVRNWSLLVALVLGALAMYDVWRGAAPLATSAPLPAHFPSAPLLLSAIAALFIAHSMVLASGADRRRIASYSAYFDAAWSLLVQLKFSGLFIGALWLVLRIGAALFGLVKLDFLAKLLEHAWFVIPVLCFGFACAIQITDVRPAIVRGIRTLLLVLMSWLLPLATLLMGGFLLTLPWTGLAPLWATRHATAVLLGSAAMLVVLINSAVQNGQLGRAVPIVIRLSARIASLLLVLLVGIAIYAVALRVLDYGWTPERILVSACLLIASCYALGYAWAALRHGPWMASMASVNIATAIAVVFTLLGLCSPMADPARLSVNSQMARLAAGKIKADAFDFAFLRFGGERFGIAGLTELSVQGSGPDAALIRTKATVALASSDRWAMMRTEENTHVLNLASNFTVWPKGAQLPASMPMNHAWPNNEAYPECFLKEGAACDAFLLDADGDGQNEVLVVDRDSGHRSTLLSLTPDKKWRIEAYLPPSMFNCVSVLEKLQLGQFKLVPARLRDLEIDGVRYPITAQPRSIDCLNIPH